MIAAGVAVLTLNRFGGSQTIKRDTSSNLGKTNWNSELSADHMLVLLQVSRYLFL